MYQCKKCKTTFVSYEGAALCCPQVQLVDVLELPESDAEQRRVPDPAEQKCPNCNGVGEGATEDGGWICTVCNGTGISKRSAGG